MNIFEGELSLAGISVLMAAWHAKLIRRGRPIYHEWWAVIFGVFVVVAYCLSMLKPGYTAWQGLAYLVAQCCSHLLFFNIFLNLFRDLPWTYISPSSTSILEGWEFKLFGHRTWILDGLCAVVFIGLQFFL